MESSQWENGYHLTYRKVSFLTGPHSQLRGVGPGIKQTYICVDASVVSSISSSMGSTRSRKSPN